MSRLNHLWPLLLLTGIVFFAYARVTTLYFQQDEWVGFGQILSNTFPEVVRNYSLLDLVVGKDRILAVPLNYVLFWLRPFSSLPYALYAIVNHIFNTMLVYLVIYNVIKHKLISSVGSLFFGLSFVSHQAVTWFGAVTTTQPSTTFFLISVLLLQKYLSDSSSKYLYGFQVAAIISFLLKESSLFLLLYLPLYARLVNGKIPILRTFGLLFGYNALVAFMRIHYFFSPVGQTGSFVSRSLNVIAKLGIHLLMFPLLSISQYIIPPHVMFKMASLYQAVEYKFLASNMLSQAVAENIVTDFFSLFFSGAILFLAFLLLKVKTYRVLGVGGIALMLTGVLPYVVLDKGTSYLDSRYYYTGMVGTAFLIAAFIHYLALNKHIHRGIFLVSMGVVIFGLYKNFVFIQREINRQRLISDERTYILKRVKELHPALPNRVVFYITGSKNNYYGLDGLSVPFQLGPGFTFMVWYFQGGTVSKELIAENFLTDLRFQGYREIGGRGFGYFTSLLELESSIKKNKSLEKENIVALYYDSEKKALSDISEKIKKRINENQ